MSRLVRRQWFGGLTTALSAVEGQSWPGSSRRAQLGRPRNSFFDAAQNDPERSRRVALCADPVRAWLSSAGRGA